jgi:hypothetical protein
MCVFVFGEIAGEIACSRVYLFCGLLRHIHPVLTNHKTCDYNTIKPRRSHPPDSPKRRRPPWGRRVAGVFLHVRWRWSAVAEPRVSLYSSHTLSANGAKQARQQCPTRPFCSNLLGCRVPSQSWSGPQGSHAFQRPRRQRVGLSQRRGGVSGGHRRLWLCQGDEQGVSTPPTHLYHNR